MLTQVTSLEAIYQISPSFFWSHKRLYTTLFTHAVVMPNTCKYTLMTKIGAVPLDLLSLDTIPFSILWVSVFVAVQHEAYYTVYHCWWVRNVFFVSVLCYTISTDDKYPLPTTSGSDVRLSFCGKERQQGSPVWNWCAHPRHWRMSPLSQLLALGESQGACGQNCFHISFQIKKATFFVCNWLNFKNCTNQCLNTSAQTFSMKEVKKFQS